ncbi:MAG: hypothetical protein NTV34_14425, partial [Proteobacteria bacterium]|nr:hypothetical protein [Pseudomonadota bacterium]
SLTTARVCSLIAAATTLRALPLFSQKFNPVMAIEDAINKITTAKKNSVASRKKRDLRLIVLSGFVFTKAYQVC